MPPVGDPVPPDDDQDRDIEEGAGPKGIGREVSEALRQANVGREVGDAWRQAKGEVKGEVKDAVRQAKREAKDAVRQAAREAGEAARQAGREAGAAARRAARDATAAARRAADPADRIRDAERTRQRILDAALVEFADKGYEGARVREIAHRAGVNAQLISYYFGGKAGLYDEIEQRWHEREQHIERQHLSLPDLATAYFRELLARPDLVRIFIREGLAHLPQDPPEDRNVTTDAPEVEDFRRRQAAGEIADDLDPAYVLVLLMCMTSAPVTMPHEIERLCGVRADSPEFARTFLEQLRRVVGHLAGSRAAHDAGTASSDSPPGDARGPAASDGEPTPAAHHDDVGVASRGDEGQR
jgi:AcrR family transcriptional regulator